jgi:ribulose 1,5-bisphosphate carboxylase large subunit-like protein
LQPFSALRILDIEFPDSFRHAYPGPRFGVAGTRRLSGVAGRPLIGTIVKPSVGLSPDETARFVEQLAAGGIPTLLRMINCRPYAFNLTGEVEHMVRRHDIGHMHGNGLRNKFHEPDESVLRPARTCLTPMVEGHGRGCEVKPVFSSGQTIRQAPDTWKGLGGADRIYAAGGGLMAHPGGVAAGATYARSYREPRQALENYAL